MNSSQVFTDGLLQKIAKYTAKSPKLDCRFPLKEILNCSNHKKKNGVRCSTHLCGRLPLRPSGRRRAVGCRERRSVRGEEVSGSFASCVKASTCSDFSSIRREAAVELRDQFLEQCIDLLQRPGGLEARNPPRVLDGPSELNSHPRELLLDRRLRWPGRCVFEVNLRARRAVGGGLSHDARRSRRRSPSAFIPPRTRPSNSSSASLRTQ